MLRFLVNCIIFAAFCLCVVLLVTQFPGIMTALQRGPSPTGGDGQPATGAPSSGAEATQTPIRTGDDSSTPAN
jgi:hypothetical protein